MSVKWSNQQPSIFSTIRIQAKAILQGPQNMLWGSHVKNEPPYYGWPVLLLEKSKAAPNDYIELRGIYANLYDDTQDTAILRAVSWNGEAIRKLVAEQSNNFHLIIPARFIKLPVERVKTWLLEFDRINVTITMNCKEDAENIKRLRIEQDYNSCIFEKVWQAQSSSHSKLNRKWDQIWDHMTQVLVNESPFTDLTEKFWYITPEINYDFQNYQPNWFNLT